MSAGVGERLSGGAVGKTLPLLSLLASRTGLVAVSLFYAVTLHYAHQLYLNVKWAYYGFPFVPYRLGEVALMVALVIVGALAMPRLISRPGAVILWQLYVITYIPIIVITLALAPDALRHYGPCLVALALGFLAACRIAVFGGSVSETTERGGLPSVRFAYIALAVWVLASAILIYVYRDIMQFSGLDDIYFQREQASGELGVLSYLRTYYLAMLTPLVLVIGLTTRQWLFVAAGLAGSILTYMIDAQKVALAVPLAIIAMDFLLNRRRPTWASAGLLTMVIALPILPMVLSFSFAGTRSNLSPSELALDIFVFRMIGLPGLTFSQYFELFSTHGYTFWSNTRGISMLVPAPANFANDPSWPSLGYIVGDYYYGSRLVNANANLFSGEGAAAAGPIGVVVVSVVLGLWLNILNRVCRGWDSRFVTLLMIPIGLALTNGHLSTILISFGGALYTILFFLLKPESEITSQKRQLVLR